MWFLKPCRFPGYSCNVDFPIFIEWEWILKFYSYCCCYRLWCVQALRHLISIRNQLTKHVVAYHYSSYCIPTVVLMKCMNWFISTLIWWACLLQCQYAYIHQCVRDVLRARKLCCERDNPLFPIYNNLL